MFSKALIALAFTSFTLPLFSSESISEMTLEEKVGQLLMVHFNGETANEDAEKLIQKHYVGGFIYYNWSNGLTSPKQVLELSSSLQKLNEENPHPIPLFIAVDQEGGRVQRLKNGFTLFPTNESVASSLEPELAKKVAESISEELLACGVNFNLAPVVDVNSNPKNPVIGNRSFGKTAETVILFAKEALLGYKNKGMITSLKHFPGHGDVEVDSHKDLPILNKTKEELELLELLPFRTLAKDADTVMTAHLLVPTIDHENPATLSKKVLDILRTDIGFKGVIISDSLVMEGVLKRASSIEEVAIKALNAGCDILLLGGKQMNQGETSLELSVKDVAKVHEALIVAVKSGKVSEARVNEAVLRILQLKEKYHL